ncbi:MAG: beta-propeller fold lactonase family protein [Pirellulaceae bacterium]|jgi:YVTN family beta-propeller protein|nr:beta-propeller fold lactonase family protein [Pirellulaceae bacterium]
MNRTAQSIMLLVSVLAALLGAWLTPRDELLAQDVAISESPAASAYRSPFAVVTSPDGKTIYATDQTGGRLSILDVASMTACGEIELHGRPQGLALSNDGSTLYVAEHGASSVAVIDTNKQTITSRIAVGLWPTAVALGEQSRRLYVANQDRDSISVIDLRQHPAKTITEIAVVREPSSLALTPDERHIVVTNLMALGRGTDPTLSAVVSIIDTGTLAAARSVKLPPGSTMVPGVAVSPDGKWAYVVHGLGRFNLPITQLERGWVNTNALSIIDIAGGSRLATLLLDDLMQGAADPHSLVVSQDGKHLWITHTGVHEVSSIDIGLVHELLEGNVPDDLASLKDGSQANIWNQVKHNREKIADLENDLTGLYIAGVIHRFRAGGTGPRGLALSSDGQALFVANYFSGSVTVLDASTGSLQGSISLGAAPDPDSVRRGATIFHDATHAFQRWHSCASCHANEGRIDGLRWDFLGDGIGNPKDTLSLLHFDQTEPMNRRATMQSSRACTKNGLESTNMIVPTEKDVDDLYAYLISLRPVPSPHLTPDGKLTESAERGKSLFEGKASCVRCHPAPYFTDKQMHNVGVLSPNEPDGRYDTPSLLESYRTAPYLHDGRALTLKEIFTANNEAKRHGDASSLTEQEVDDLVAYLLSL